MLVLLDFFPRVLSKTHQTPSESCIGLCWSLMESDVFKNIIALGIYIYKYCAWTINGTESSMPNPSNSSSTTTIIIHDAPPLFPHHHGHLVITASSFATVTIRTGHTHLHPHHATSLTKRVLTPLNDGFHVATSLTATWQPNDEQCRSSLLFMVLQGKCHLPHTNPPH